MTALIQFGTSLQIKTQMLEGNLTSPTFSCHFHYGKYSLQPLASEMLVIRLFSSHWLEFLHSQCFDKQERTGMKHLCDVCVFLTIDVSL